MSKKCKSLRLTREQQVQLIEEYQKNYVLKVCGTQEYLLERHPISQYKVGCYPKVETTTEQQKNSYYDCYLIFFSNSTFVSAYPKGKFLNCVCIHVKIYMLHFRRVYFIFRHTYDERWFLPLSLTRFPYGN